jgi:hypothetical protein
MSVAPSAGSFFTVSSLTYPETDGEVLPKSRMREIFTSCSVRGIVTLGLLHRGVAIKLHSASYLILWMCLRRFNLTRVIL